MWSSPGAMYTDRFTTLLDQLLVLLEDGGQLPDAGDGGERSLGLVVGVVVAGHADVGVVVAGEDEQVGDAELLGGDAGDLGPVGDGRVPHSLPMTALTVGSLR